MMPHIRWFKAAALVAFSLAILTGCGPRKPAEVLAPVFYPPSPDQPRLQFLVSFSEADRWAEHRSSFSDFILGRKKEMDAEIRHPYGIAARGGRIYICDVGLHKVHVVDVVNKSYGVLGTPEQVANPVNITIGADGTKYVCDTRQGLIAVFDKDDRFVKHLGDPQRCVPSDVAIGEGKLFVADIANGEIEVWSEDGTPLATFSRKGCGHDELRMPTNLALGPNGHVFVVDTELATVKEFDQQGRYIKSIGEPGDRPGFFARPKGIAIDADGHIYVADAQGEIIQVFSPEGWLLLYFGGVQTGPAGMGLPAGVALDATSLGAFQQFVDKTFEPHYLLFVANQFGMNKIGVYAFGGPKPEAPQPESPEPSPSQ